LWHRQANGLNHSSRGQRPRFIDQGNTRPCKGKPNYVTIGSHMPQSLHVLSVHIIFSTKGRQPWLPPTIRKRVWVYQSRILQNLECNSITIGGVADHVHVLCNLTKKFPTAKVLEILKKDSSKDVGRARFSLARWLRAFQCKPVALRSGEEIHSRPRRASQKGDVPAGISANSEKIPSAVR